MRFSNNPDNICNNIDKLPDEIVDIIYSYIPNLTTTFISKNNYLRDHKLIRQYIDKNEIENYIRTMVRQDNDLIFEQLLVENYHKWILMKNYYYKGCVYSDYLVFLESYIMDNESIKCKKILNELFEELALNQYKKKTLTYI